MFHRIAARRLSYDLIGPQGGRTVCFVHALGADGGMWAEQIAPLLARDMRVLRIDLRGHGGSDADEDAYTLFDLAGDMAVLLDGLGIGGVDYVGLSIGGMIGEAFALHYPARVASLLLCETPPAALAQARKIWAPRMAAVRAAGSLEPIADATMERWLTPQFRARNPARWQQIRDTIAANSVAGYCGGIAALSDFDFTTALPRLRVPALVVFGEDDPASSHEENRRLASLIPGGRFLAFAGARHLPNVEDPARFNRILVDWLDGVRR